MVDIELIAVYLSGLAPVYILLLKIARQQSKQRAELDIFRKRIIDMEEKI